MDRNSRVSIVKPENLKSLGVLGYLIVLNNQVHSYEMKALERYLDTIGLNIEDTCIDSIIRGSEVSVSYSSSYDAFYNENIDVKACLLYFMYVIAYVDNHFADEENRFINEILKSINISGEQLQEIKNAAVSEAQEIRSQNNTIFVRKKKNINDKKSIWKKIIEWIILFFHKFFKKSPREETIDNNNLDYEKIIEKCADIAKEDLSYVEPAYNRVIKYGQDVIEAINDYKKGLSLETGLSASVAKTINSFVEVLNNEVIQQTNKERACLEQKKRTVSDFTISLIGRTKAGKSTLHSILTQQGKDRIGVGRQRTTRYNWVYQWNLLRIIDTPGIGSAEADGRKDEEIAESVLGESDIICFVVADDSILKDILEFIEKIALLNKPVIILLNHKENIRPAVKFRRFINDPEQWLNDEGESSLRGYENRIRKYAEDRGFGQLVNVFPVFLLPALMSEEEEFQEYSDLLWENSNINSFIDKISSWILYSGSIKRSQTILDETVKAFERAKDSVVSSRGILDDQITLLEKNREEKMGLLRKTLNETVNSVRSMLEDKFDSLANNDALLFAEEYVISNNKMGKNLEECWTAYVERIGFEKNVRQEIDNIVNIYEEKADRTIKELFEDIYYSLAVSVKVSEADIPIQFDIKTVMRLTSSAITLAGSILLVILGTSNPIGWVLTVVGGVGSFLTSLFTSKEKRRQDAVEKVYKSVHDAINKETPGQIDKLVGQIENELNKNVDSIDAIFVDLIHGLNWSKQMAVNISGEYSREIEKINKVYGWRILQYLEKKNDSLEEKEINKEIVLVDRSDNNVIRIKTESNHSFQVGNLKTVLAEDIIIERR